MLSKPTRRDQLAFIVVVGTACSLAAGIAVAIFARSIFAGALAALVTFALAVLVHVLMFALLGALDWMSGGAITNPQNDAMVRRISGSIARVIARFLGCLVAIVVAVLLPDVDSRRRIAKLEEEVARLRQALGEKQMNANNAIPTIPDSGRSDPGPPVQASSREVAS